MSNGVFAPSSQPDVRLLGRMEQLRVWLLLGVVPIAGVVLLAWLLPRLASVLPSGWSEMKANTALCALLCAASLGLSESGPHGQRHRPAFACAALALGLALAAQLEHAFGALHGVSVLLAADAGATHPGLMSRQTSIFFSMLATVLVLERQGHPRRLIGLFQDLLGVALFGLSLMLLAGYVFGATRLIGQDAYTFTSPHTLVCMVMLCLAWVTRRSQDGFFSVLWGMGIGSRIARKVLPAMTLLPFVLVSAGCYAAAAGWMSAPDAAALICACIALLLYLLTMLTARHTNDQERSLRAMSLTDELTGAYNRRGFYLLGEHSLLEARRTGTPLSVLFVDLDGLKTVNDARGHETGSKFIADVADLLRRTFRNSDVIGRVGGDEFAVVVRADKESLAMSLARLEQARLHFVATAGRPYELMFSLGAASCGDMVDALSFEELVDRADALMYQVKRERQRMRGDSQLTRPAELAAA